MSDDEERKINNESDQEYQDPLLEPIQNRIVRISLLLSMVDSIHHLRSLLQKIREDSGRIF